MTAQLLRSIREEVIGLLFNRYVFRTHQEIVRLNPHLQGEPRFIFCRWAQVIYVQANAAGVRRLASATHEAGDVNLVRLLEILIRDPGRLWDCFQGHYPGDAARVRADILKTQKALPTGWEILACKRLLSEDRKTVISAAEKANQFASKRVAHSVPAVVVNTTFSDLDDAIEVARKSRRNIHCWFAQRGDMSLNHSTALENQRSIRYLFKWRKISTYSKK